MSNMSYCRFQNTLSDLHDCFDEISNYSSKEELFEELSRDEVRAAKKLFALCNDIVNEFPEEDDED